MRKQILIAIVAVVMGVSIFGAPSASQATLVTSVTVTIGSTTYSGCETGVVCGPVGSLQIWDLGLTGVNLAAGQSLTLAQTSGFNFDTSDLRSASNPVITVNATPSFTDSTGTLNFNGTDPVNNTFNEAKDYTSLGTNGSFQVLVGYFDNVHSDACLDLPTLCRPDPFFAGTTLIGAGTANPGITEPPGTSHCDNAGGASNCWDSGVVQIVALSGVPEPTSLLLLGSGLIGVAAWRRRHLKKSA